MRRPDDAGAVAAEEDEEDEEEEEEEDKEDEEDEEDEEDDSSEATAENDGFIVRAGECGGLLASEQLCVRWTTGEAPVLEARKT